jgi:tRNA(Ile)-lysidine synthase
VEESGLEPVHDPTNADLGVPRNLVRHRLLPHLAGRDPQIVERLCALARAAAAAARRLEEVLSPHLRPRPLSGCRGAAVDRRALQQLPEPLFAPALALLSRRAGAPHPPGAPARRELRRQLAAASRTADSRTADSRGVDRGVGCDCGGGWRWEGDRSSLRLLRREPPAAHFAYTLRVPGEVEIPELGLKVRLRRGRVDPWMFRGRAERAGLASSLPTGTRVEIRNRRPGDRIQPLGGKERLRLKDLLIARRVPRHLRDRLPLLVIDGMVAWVPGVTIDERFRLGDEKTTWIAEIDRGPATGAGEAPYQHDDDASVETPASEDPEKRGPSPNDFLER